jgi:predicted Fe-Mo cluster-binding NifX family protein
VINAGAEAVVTGHCGPKAFRVLSAAEVAVYTGAEGTVAQVLDRLRNGDWQPSQGADVEGHWV